MQRSGQLPGSEPIDRRDRSQRRSHRGTGDGLAEHPATISGLLRPFLRQEFNLGGAQDALI